VGGSAPDFDFLDDDGGCGDAGCHSRHGRGESVARALAGASKKPEKRSWRQMMIGAILLLAMSGGLITTLWSIVDYLTGASLFPFVDVKTDESTLKEIFSGGNPYVVYCQAGKSKLIPKLLIEGANMLPRGFSTALLNCQDVILSSETSINDRFNIDPTGMPGFVVANGEKPVQFSREAFYNAEYFAEFAKTQTVPKLKEITNETQFRSSCSRKSRCIAIGHKGKLSNSDKSAIEDSNSYWRKQKVATIDTSKHAIKLDEVLTASLEVQMKEGKTGKGYLSALCLENPEEFSEIPSKGMVRRITESEVYYFMKDCMNGVGLAELKHVPSLDVKSASKKKQRKTERKPKTTTSAPEKKPEATNSSNQYADDGMEVEDL
jgi:hypothetical protein